MTDSQADKLTDRQTHRATGSQAKVGELMHSMWLKIGVHSYRDKEQLRSWQLELPTLCK